MKNLYIKDFILQSHGERLEKRVFLIINNEKYSITDISYRTNEGLKLILSKENDSLNLEEILKILHYMNLQLDMKAQYEDKVYEISHLQKSNSLELHIE